MTAGKIAAAALVIGASALVNLGAQAQAQSYSGASDYQAYCSSCHGTGAEGDGVIAKSLKRRPADLTELARRNNGLFPEEKVFNTVDGRRSSAHSDSDMPAWAEVFAKATESAGADKAAARIDVLVQYLQTLQVK